MLTHALSHKVTAGLVVGTGLFGVGEIPDVGSLGPLAQLGAVGVLAWACKALLAELREARADAKEARLDAAHMRAEYSVAFSAAVDRAEKRDAAYHSDSQSLQNTLREMTANCAKAITVHDTYKRTEADHRE